MQIFDISLISWGIFFFVNGIVLMSSYCLASKLTSSSIYSVTLGSMLLIYVSQITVSVLLFGVVFQWLEGLPLGIFNVIFSFIITLLFWSCRKPFISSCQSGVASILHEGNGWTYILMALLLLQIAISLFKVVIMPVHIADSLAYRAPPAVMWFQMGMIPSVLDVPVNEMNGRSLGIAVLMLWYFIFLDDSLLVNLPQFISSITLIFIVFAIARQCGVSRVWSFNAAVLCYFLPSVLIQSTATQDHLSVNVAFLAALFFLRELFLRNERSIILLFGVAVGLMFSFKNNAVVYLPVLAGAGLYLFLAKREDMLKLKPYKNWLQYSFIAILIAFSIGGYWTARNILVFGDPFGLTFAPMNKINNVYHLVTEEKKTLDSGEVATVNVFTSFLKGNNLIGNLKDFFPRILDDQAPEYFGHMRNISGFGPQFFAFGLPALAWLIIAVFRRSWRCSGMYYAVSGLVLLAIYFCVMRNIYAYRNFIFFAVLLLIFFACIQTYLKHKNQTMSHAVNFLMVVSVVWTMYVVLPPTFFNPGTFKEFVSLDRTHQTSGRYARFFRAHPKILRELNEFPENEPMVYINPGARNTWIYANYDVHWKRKVEYVAMREELVHCNDAYCIPTNKFKQLLIQKGVHLVNMCVSDACPKLKDPDFFIIGRGLHYFESRS